MGRQIDRRSEIVSSDHLRELAKTNPANRLPAAPINVFSLVVDYTKLTMPELESVRSLIGGGNGPVVKLDPNVFREDAMESEPYRLLGKALESYPCQMLFLLVPWGMDQVDDVVRFMRIISNHNPRVVFQLGRELYCTEMAMTIDPLSEGDAELRQDPEINSPALQWLTRL